jgi:hypothetical protein
VTFAGRFFGVFFAGAGNAAAVGEVAGVAVIAGVAGVDAVLDTPARAGFEDCFEHALKASNSPRIAKPAIIASFCCRDQDESVVPETVLLVALLLDFLSPDFQVVAIVSPPLRLAQSEVIGQESGQMGGH